MKKKKPWALKPCVKGRDHTWELVGHFPFLIYQCLYCGQQDLSHG